MCSNINFFMIPQNFIVIFLIIILIVKVFIIAELIRINVFQCDYNSLNFINILRIFIAIQRNNIFILKNFIIILK